MGFTYAFSQAVAANVREVCQCSSIKALLYLQLTYRNHLNFAD